MDIAIARNAKHGQTDGSTSKNDTILFLVDAAGQIWPLHKRAGELAHRSRTCEVRLPFEAAGRFTVQLFNRGERMVPVDLVKMLRKKTNYAARMSHDISRSIDWVPPELALNSSRNLETHAEEMRNILVGLIATDCDLPLRESASRLVSKYSDLALRASAETNLRFAGMRREVLEN